MHSTTAIAMMLSTSCYASILSPRDMEPQPFTVRSKLKGAENFDRSLGNLSIQYEYSGYYNTILSTDKSDGYAYFIDPKTTVLQTGYEGVNSLEFNFVFDDLSERNSYGMPRATYANDGTPGVTDEDGMLNWNAPDGVKTTWFGEYSPNVEFQAKF